MKLEIRKHIVPKQKSFSESLIFLAQKNTPKRIKQKTPQATLGRPSLAVGLRKESILPKI